MKKLTFLFACLIMVALIVSCSEEATYDGDVMLKKAVASGPSTPVSDAGIIPQIIPGENKGGNRTCLEVETAFNLPAGSLLCGDKIDFNGSFFVSTSPLWPNVTVTDGKYVSFEMDGCLQFGDKFYKVGAVIVKGSNAANVYYYPGGTSEDSGLASPENASGNPAGLSNLTFCFVECEPLIIAVKLLYWSADNYPTGVTYIGFSEGSVAFPGNTAWCGVGLLGYKGYPRTEPIAVLGYMSSKQVAEITFSEGKIIITALEGRTLDASYVYIGTLSNLQTQNLEGNGCPDYTNWLTYTVDGPMHEFTP
jgi:hypothetical protein